MTEIMASETADVPRMSRTSGKNARDRCCALRNELQLVLLAATELLVGELPGLLGQIEEIRVTALARLTAPPPAPPAEDELLDVETAANKLGMSTDYLYRNHRQFSFTRRVGKRLLFSKRQLEKYIRTANLS